MANEQRLVVANGSRMLETRDGDSWRVDRVEPAAGVAKGVYNLHSAKLVETATRQNVQGTIIHADKRHVFQSLDERTLVAYDRKAFQGEPPIGRRVTVAVDQGRAQVAPDRERDAGRDR